MAFEITYIPGAEDVIRWLVTGLMSTDASFIPIPIHHHRRSGTKVVL